MADTQVYHRPSRRASAMTIIVEYHITAAERQAIGAFMGTGKPAEREDVRAFMRELGREGLDTLTRPLVKA